MADIDIIKANQSKSWGEIGGLIGKTAQEAMDIYNSGVSSEQQGIDRNKEFVTSVTPGENQAKIAAANAAPKAGPGSAVAEMVTPQLTGAALDQSLDARNAANAASLANNYPGGVALNTPSKPKVLGTSTVNQNANTVDSEQLKFRPGETPDTYNARIAQLYNNPLSQQAAREGGITPSTGVVDRVNNPTAQGAISVVNNMLDNAEGSSVGKRESSEIGSDYDRMLDFLLATKPEALPSEETQLSDANRAAGFTTAQNDLAAANENLRQFEAKLLSEKGKIQSTPGLTRAYINGELVSLDQQTAESYRQAQIKVQGAADRLQMATQQVGQLLTLRGQNYQNQRAEYEFEQNKAFQFLQMFQTQKNREEDKNQQNAQASLTAFLNVAGKSPDALANATPADKAQWAQWDQMAGYPSGFTEGLLGMAASVPNQSYQVVGSAEGGYSVISIDQNTGKVTTTSVIGAAPGSNTENESKEFTRVKAIVSAHPGEWGHAADQIDAEFGQGTATKYDDYLKSKYSPEALKRMTASTVDSQTMADLQSDIGQGVTLAQLYEAYPELSPSLVQSIYYNQ